MFYDIPKLILRKLLDGTKVLVLMLLTGAPVYLIFMLIFDGDLTHPFGHPRRPWASDPCSPSPALFASHPGLEAVYRQGEKDLEILEEHAKARDARIDPDRVTKEEIGEHFQREIDSLEEATEAVQDRWLLACRAALRKPPGKLGLTPMLPRQGPSSLVGVKDQR